MSYTETDHNNNQTHKLLNSRTQTLSIIHTIKNHQKSMEHTFQIPKPLFLGFLFNTETHLLVEPEHFLKVGETVELQEIDSYSTRKTGRVLQKTIFQIAKHNLNDIQDHYYQLTLLNHDQYERLNKLPGLAT